MFHPPEHNHNLSMRLSEVLRDIGVTETTVKKTRKSWMINEALFNMKVLLKYNDDFTHHFFGSQSEASSTEGLKSDIDNLICYHEIKVIQDWSQWQPNRLLQYLMVQDETTSPGYCLLQLLRDDVPLPMQDEDAPHGFSSTDSKGRVLVRHSMCLGYLRGAPIHGPAQAGSKDGLYDVDVVVGLHCPYWPRDADLWLTQQNMSGWPTRDMKRYSADQGYVVVPVCSRTSMYQDQEWRISTSFTERCLMYNVNITQLRCYILLKMIVKTFLKPKCGEAVSSFMCKSILFHCIANSAASSIWNEGSLLTWLNKCLQTLFNCILTENCPHFVIPRNNLLAGKLTAQVKHRVVDVMCTLTENIEESLMCLRIDDLGHRLYVKSSGLRGVYLRPADQAAFRRAFVNIDVEAQYLIMTIRMINSEVCKHDDQDGHNLTNSLLILCQLYLEGSSDIERTAICLLTPFLCTSVGSKTASEDIGRSRNISPEAVKWFSLGLNSDLSSSKLKLASALYCAGDLVRCEMVLDHLRGLFSQTTFATQCYCDENHTLHSKYFERLCYEENKCVIKHNMAFCVMYLPNEVNCIPDELKYEMFRTTEEDRPYRAKGNYWMDWAVVDSIPYLYFLQYKVYSQLHKQEDKHRALYNLAAHISTDPYQLGHRETALSLLGQCMEHENRQQEALYCYTMSLNIRGRNNAAKWHVYRLLAGLFNRQSH